VTPNGLRTRNRGAKCSAAADTAVGSKIYTSILSDVCTMSVRGILHSSLHSASIENKISSIVIVEKSDWHYIEQLGV
jgi:hypothetical protein